MDLPENNTKQEKNFLILTLVIFFLTLILIISTGFYFLSTEKFSTFFESEYFKEIYNEVMYNIPYQIRNLDVVNKEELQILSKAIAKDNTNVYKYGVSALIYNDTSFKPLYYNLYYMDGKIWAENIFDYSGVLTKLDVETPEKFKLIGEYSENKNLYSKYSINEFATLFEDDKNYYSWKFTSDSFNKYKK